MALVQLKLKKNLLKKILRSLGCEHICTGVPHTDWKICHGESTGVETMHVGKSYVTHSMEMLLPQPSP